VIGVAFATVQAGQNLNFAIPSNYLKTLLANIKPQQPPSKITGEFVFEDHVRTRWFEQGDTIIIPVKSVRYRVDVAKIGDTVVLKVPGGTLEIGIGKERYVDLDNDAQAELRVVYNDIDRTSREPRANLGLYRIGTDTRSTMNGNTAPDSAASSTPYQAMGQPLAYSDDIDTIRGSTSDKEPGVFFAEITIGYAPNDTQVGAEISKSSLRCRTRSGLLRPHPGRSMQPDQQHHDQWEDQARGISSDRRNEAVESPLPSSCLSREALPEFMWLRKQHFSDSWA
jgi:hypothetical protein